MATSEVETSVVNISQFQRGPSAPSNHRASAHVVSLGGRAFAILSRPGAWPLAYPGDILGQLTHVFVKDG